MNNAKDVKPVAWTRPGLLGYPLFQPKPLKRPDWKPLFDQAALDAAYAAGLAMREPYPYTIGMKEAFEAMHCALATDKLTGASDSIYDAISALQPRHPKGPNMNFWLVLGGALTLFCLFGILHVLERLVTLLEVCHLAAG